MRLLVLAVLEHRAERALNRRGVEPWTRRRRQRDRPVDGLGDARRLCTSLARRRETASATAIASAADAAGTQRRTISTSRSGGG